MQNRQEIIGPNKKVLDVLAKSKKPLTAYEILGKLANKGVSAPPTVYRALEKLIKLGLAHRIESLNAFMACNLDEDHHHADNFAVCKSCGNVTEIHDHKLEKVISEWSKSVNFAMEREMVEVLGTCSPCQEKAA